MTTEMPLPLHELEAEVMEEVWRQRETTVKEVMEALNAQAPAARAYTTYMTVMRRLADKGLLARSRAGRRDTYVPVHTRAEYQQLRAAAEVSSLVDECGDVALAQFARSLDSLDPARRRALRKLAGRE